MIDEISEFTHKVKMLETKVKEKEVECRLADLKIKELKK